MKFKLSTNLTATGDQPKAIEKLISGIEKRFRYQVLLGITGSGKTFTMANVIAGLQKPALVISHNKTLAAQLYQEFRDLFPRNAVGYFVSYYDFYQPEAYIPQTDTYIEKETQINEQIDKLRLAATTNILTRNDTIVVASVSCIYNLGSPGQYRNHVLDLIPGKNISLREIVSKLVDLQYTKTNYDFKRSTFRVRGETIDVFLSYEDIAMRITLENEVLKRIATLDPYNGKEIKTLISSSIYPAKHYLTDHNQIRDAFPRIRIDLEERVKILKNENKLLEAERLRKRVNYDLEMIEEVGYINGIENYSRYFDQRKPGDPPFTLFDYFQEQFAQDWLLFIDESHMTIPQLRGMYNGDRSRKQTLIDFGFRLPAALDNRPLTFTELLKRMPRTIYVSATPSPWEISMALEGGQVVEQLLRPTGILDPEIIIRKTKNQIVDLIKEIIKRKERGERVLVTTLTKRMAEDLALFFNEKKYMDILPFSDMIMNSYPVVHYLHADVKTLERSDILDDLRLGKFDVIIGINLLREGLDLPEVSLVAILDADKEGFLRSTTSLIQTMGRAARHVNGTVIMYADKITASMEKAIGEIKRRRSFQTEFNKKYNIIPITISKPIREKLIDREENEQKQLFDFLDPKQRTHYKELLAVRKDNYTPRDLLILVKKLEKEMKKAAEILNFELAAEIRDKIREMKGVKYAG